MEWIRKPISQIIIILSAVGAWLLCLATIWVCTLPLLWQVPIGMIMGLAPMVSYFITQTQRAHSRRICSLGQAQLSAADIVSLMKLFPASEKAQSWVPEHTDAGARWINMLLNKIWPHFKEASAELIKLHLQDSLNRCRSQIIQQLQVRDLELGNSCPDIQEIKVLHEEGTKISLEIQFDWRHNENQQMMLHVLTLGPEYIVQVKDFVIYGIMKLTFVPFTEELPCFGAIVFSIMGHPLIDFRSRFLSGDLHKMPEVENAVDSTLLATLMDLLVWPSRVVVPVIPGDYSALEVTSVGFLYVHLLEAKDLANRDITGRSDPYVVLFVQRADRLSRKSKPLHDTSDPVWNEDFVFKIQDPTVQKLTVKVMNWDDKDLDVCVGTAEFPISQLQESSQQDVWIDLVGDPEKLHEKYAGKVHVRLEFRPQDASMSETMSSTSTGNSAAVKSNENLKLDEHNITFLDGLKVALGTSDDTTYPKFALVRNMNAVTIKELNILDARNGNLQKIDTNREDSMELNVLDARCGTSLSIDTKDVVDSITTNAATDGLKSDVEGNESISSSILIVSASDQFLSQSKSELFMCKDDNNIRDDGTGSARATSTDEIRNATETASNATIPSGNECSLENLEICNKRESIGMATIIDTNMGSDLIVLNRKTSENSCTSTSNRESEHNFIEKDTWCTDAAMGNAEYGSIPYEQSSKDGSVAEFENRDRDAHSSGRLAEDHVYNDDPVQQKPLCWNISEDMFDSELFEVD